METIAEYVETDNLRVRMTELGVDYGQGFSMGKPMPLKELLEELAIYEATVNDRQVEPEPAGSMSSVTRLKRSMFAG
jgi:predicted signal transduction protein with EAL and GGDEF domain